MKLVLDASMALSWLFERPHPNDAECADKALQAIPERETLVPWLWHLEITNALLVAERRHVVTEAQVIDYLNRLYKLPIKTDHFNIVAERHLIMALAREHALTAYDATYLELALRTDAVLATFDAKLAAAMRHAGGNVFYN